METSSQCSRCLYDTSHPLGLEIDDKGICSGCLIHEEKDCLDWDHRWNELLELVKNYRCKQKVKYDCIVPVSGANDSYYILHIVKNKLNLNPLVVTYNKYFNTPIGIKNLANLRTKFDVDVLIQNINPTIVKKITKTISTFKFQMRYIIGRLNRSEHRRKRCWCRATDVDGEPWTILNCL